MDILDTITIEPSSQDLHFNKTPCVGRCSTVYGDPICRGCKRFMTEVSFWNQLDISQRRFIWQRLDQLAVRIMPQFVRIVDQSRLVEFLQKNNIRYPKHISVESWAMHCIENFPAGLGHLQEAGLLLVPKDDIASLKDLKLNLQKTLYRLSLAEQERQSQYLT